MCIPATDAEVFARPGLQEKYSRILLPSFGFTSVWDRWGRRPGEDALLPCPVYCRHCVLAVQREGVPKEAADSFLDDTYLADRTTPLRQHLSNAPHVMKSTPPPSLVGRYSG
eukprot:Hpha_TRINITY_DN7210_c0_g1::TRINITY_DN7210_c0_g1_i1::g.102281::m.102281